MIILIPVLLVVVGLALFSQQASAETSAPAPAIANPPDVSNLPPNYGNDLQDVPALGSPLDGENTPLITNDDGSIGMNPSTWPTGDRIWDISQAIARAEGYNTNAAPYILNNPGDLSPGDESGFATSGPAELHSGSYIIHFATPVDGWNALYTKIQRMVDGRSSVYPANFTVAQVASKWAANSSAWASNVGKQLGLDPNTQGFLDYLNA